MSWSVGELIADTSNKHHVPDIRLVSKTHSFDERLHSICNGVRRGIVDSRPGNQVGNSNEPMLHSCRGLDNMAGP